MTQILTLASNISTYPIQYINEVLLNVLLEKIKTSQKFSFVDEIRKVSKGTLPKLTSFKRLHYQKMKILSIQAIPRFKKMSNFIEKLNKRSLQVNTRSKRSKGITKFTQNLHLFRKYIYGVICFCDKVCVGALREMHNMRTISKFLKQEVSLVPKSDMKDMTMVVFRRMKNIKKTKIQAGKETQDSENKQTSESSASSHQFFQIFDNQDQSQDQANSVDNRSQFSDFSFKFDHFRKMSEDFFDF